MLGLSSSSRLHPLPPLRRLRLRHLLRYLLPLRTLRETGRVLVLVLLSMSGEQQVLILMSMSRWWPMGWEL